MTQNPDILKTISEHKKAHQWTVGFAAETENIEDYAKKKLVAKHLDMIVANDVSQTDRGFDSHQNAGVIYRKDGRMTPIPLQAKSEMAEVILAEIEKYLIQ